MRFLILIFLCFLICRSECRKKKPKKNLNEKDAKENCVYRKDWWDRNMATTQTPCDYRCLFQNQYDYCSRQKAVDSGLCYKKNGANGPNNLDCVLDEKDVVKPK